MSVDIVTRQGKGAPLTHGEMDQNFSSLKAAADDALDRLSVVESGQASGVIGYATKAEMDADLTPPDRAVAYVTNDPTPENNATYSKSGASGGGSWVKSSTDRIAELAEEIAAARRRDVATAEKAPKLLRRDALPVPFAIVDKAGRQAIGITDAGLIRILTLLMGGGIVRDSDGYEWSIKDLAGKVALGINRMGQTYLGAPLLDAADQRQGGYRFRFWVADEAGKVIIGWDRNGKTWIDPADSVLTAMTERVFLSPEVFRGGYNVFNVRRTSALHIGTIQDSDNRVFDARQLRDGLYDTAIVDGAAAVDVLLFCGQSNAGAGGSGGTILTDPLYPHHCFGFSAGVAQYGTTAVDEEALLDLAASADPEGNPATVGHYPATLTGFAIEGRNRLVGRAGPGYFLRTDWYGGQPLSSFVRGTTTWNNLMLSASKAIDVVGLYGRPAACRAFVFIQGESGPTGRAVYAPQLEAYIDDVIPELQSQLEQASPPEFFLMQINMNDTSASGNGVDLAQYDVAKARAGLGVTMPGPMYQCPLTDDIHASPLGRMVLADLLALVYERVVIEGAQFVPLWPTALVRTDNVIDVTFALPGGSLAWDEDWVLPATNYGFSFIDDAASADIASVAIIGDNTVRITLTGTPTGANKKLRYAQGLDVTDDGWAAGRGQLVSPSGKQSIFAGLGYAVPASINHYCVRFEEEIV